MWVSVFPRKAPRCRAWLSLICWQTESVFYRLLLIKSAELLSVPEAPPPRLSFIWLFFEALCASVCVCVCLCVPLSLSLPLTKNKEAAVHDHDCQRLQIRAAWLSVAASCNIHSKVKSGCIIEWGSCQSLWKDQSSLILTEYVNVWLKISSFIFNNK